MAISDFGIQEPTEQAPLIRPEEIGLALVPALCYDEGRTPPGLRGRLLRPLAGELLRDHRWPVPGVRPPAESAGRAPRPGGPCSGDGPTGPPLLSPCLSAGPAGKGRAGGPRLSPADVVRLSSSCRRSRSRCCRSCSRSRSCCSRSYCCSPSCFPPQPQMMIRIRMIHRQLLPPQPLFPKHMKHSPHSKSAETVAGLSPLYHSMAPPLSPVPRGRKFC